MTQSSTYKVSRSETTHGQHGEHQLIRGESSSMRLWHNEQPADTAEKQPSRNDYETLGYVISGRVELTVDGQSVMLEAGDSYRVPSGAEHVYRVLETLTAVEVTTPAANR
ncbi:cupin [Deinococcus malanensis]|uniref:Cupin n=1 Tax=Deinococcus malanensis TaxID=1706855 RepID=A0ABQ2EUD8_9DEIO|nr:cupin domain-containing protein [Deinococcus malanensis]GGK26756.1 cupin [Deinococcus malanensis]